VLTHYAATDHGRDVIRFQDVIRFGSDFRVSARVFLARVLWLQGFPDQAARGAQSGVEDARAANHIISLCQVLAHAACPIALLTGDLAAAEHYGAMLVDHSSRHALAHWRACGRSFQGVLVIKRGDVITGLRLLRAGFDEFGEAESPVLRLLAFLMAEGLGRAGQNADGLAAIEEAIARSERTEERWAMAELVRLRGELLLLQGAPGAGRRPSITSARRSTGRGDKVRCPGNSAPPRASPACCATGTASARRAICWRRFMSGLPKDLAPPICKEQSGLSTRCLKSSDLCSMVVDLSRLPSAV
jgi:hypothetical protein